MRQEDARHAMQARFLNAWSCVEGLG